MTDETCRLCNNLPVVFIHIYKLIFVPPAEAKVIHNFFKYNPFLLHQAQKFSSYTLRSAHETEKALFQRHVECTNINEV